MNDDEERKRKARKYARIIVKAKIIENLCSAKGPTVTDSSYRPVIDFHLTPHQLSQFMMSQVIFINYVTISDNNTVINHVATKFMFSDNNSNSYQLSHPQLSVHGVPIYQLQCFQFNTTVYSSLVSSYQISFPQFSVPSFSVPSPLVVESLEKKIWR